MTKSEVLAEFDKRFTELMEAETARMLEEGLSVELIAAVVAENRKIYAAKRDEAADSVVGPGTVH